MADIDKYVIPEDSYKADMAILDKYITFSSELLRSNGRIWYAHYDRIE